MKSLLVALLIAMTVAAGGLAWRESQRAGAARQAAADLELESVRLAAAIKAVEQRKAAAEHDCAAQQALLDAFSKPSSPTSTSAPTKAGAFDAVAHYRKMRERERDPKVQAVRLAAVQARDLERYGPLFRKLGLTAEQIDRFNQITLRRREQTWDLRDIRAEAVAKGADVAATEQAVTRLRADATAEMEAAQRELLGEVGYRELREYERSLAPRSTVSALAGSAVLAGIPFSPAQAEQVTMILAQASSDYRAGKAATERTIDWTAADEQARGVLSAEQWELFRTIDPPTSPGGRFRGGYAQQLMEEITRAEQERRRALAIAPGG